MPALVSTEIKNSWNRIEHQFSFINVIFRSLIRYYFDFPLLTMSYVLRIMCIIAISFNSLVYNLNDKHVRNAGSDILCISFVTDGKKKKTIWIAIAAVKGVAKLN